MAKSGGTVWHYHGPEFAHRQPARYGAGNQHRAAGERSEGDRRGEILAELGLTAEQLCYMGDDLPDLATLRFAGLGVAVADACDEVRQAAGYVTTAAGGPGAVRETIEMILKAQRAGTSDSVLCHLARRRRTHCHTARIRPASPREVEVFRAGLPWKRVVSSFFLVFGVYWTYALAIVPFIEPTVVAQADFSDSPIGAVQGGTSSSCTEAGPVFKPGDGNSSTKVFNRPAASCL